MSEPADKRTGGDDALCFTAGPKGAIFGIGVIHAWLAADRRPPAVAAGISTGALTATALQYSYRQLEKEGLNSDLEVRRWAWFRKYLATISNSPLDVIWKAIPDPVDFFADKPPVVDWSRPAPLIEEEAAARRHYYVLTKLGVWLGGLPVRLSTIATAAISYVRFRERYGMWLWMWVVNRFTLARIGLQVLSRLCIPPFFSERTFHIPRRRNPREEGLRGKALLIVDMALRAADYIWSWRFRPLFGWRVWLTAASTAALLVAGLGGAIAGAATPLWNLGWGRSVLATSLGGLTLLIVAILALVHRQSGRDWLSAKLFRGLGIERGLLHDYNLHRSLLELFALDTLMTLEPKLENEPFPLVLVATALENVSWKGQPLKSQQVWAEVGTPVTQAIRAAMRVKGLFPPLRLSSRADIESWVDSAGLDHLDLVDGAAISQNPLPALFGWLKDPHSDRKEVAERLCATDPAKKCVHVVYGVPIEPYPTDSQTRSERINIVESAFISRELERRRDTGQEARQTNFISEMELYVRLGRGSTGVLPIFADEIAPERDIAFSNNLDPTPVEIRKIAAAGCRRTLEVLYREELRKAPNLRLSCAGLLTQIAPRRADQISTCSGVREICSECTRELFHRMEPEGPSPGLKSTFGIGNRSQGLARDFPHLDRQRPRIVFLGSGGVFRGSFHAGVIAAMHALEIRPDLVIGASVGALMGGALCAISVLRKEEGQVLLRELCNTFLCVDRKVALTRTLKNVSKQLGTRALRIRLSPAELAHMIRQGARTDAGFAAVGAPPALIDMISDLFLIPRGRTRSIASEFVAGHIASALKRFWKQVEKETLPSLDIETYLMGTSLLEPLARRLLGERHGIQLTNSQPYHRFSHPVSFFCTTSDFHKRRPLVLGRDFSQDHDFITTPGSYDFVNAALCSSAFPAIFAPRSEAELLPGRGDTDVLLGDGGMFDNLPFFPAIEVLSAIQADYRTTERHGRSHAEELEKALEFLRERQDRPDLIIAAALDADAEPVKPGDLNTLASILDRVQSLEKNVKSKSFAHTSEQVGHQIEMLLKHPPAVYDDRFIKFVDEAVPAGVLQIIPTDANHINPTFAFCKSAGMDKARVERSIADGCFQTLRAIANVQETNGRSPTLRASINALSEDGRIPPVVAITTPRSSDGKQTCPFFDVSRKVPGSNGTLRWDAVVCPFVDASANDPQLREIRSVCAKDKKHHDLIFGRA